MSGTLLRYILRPLGSIQVSSRYAHAQAATALTNKIGNRSQIIFNKESKFGAHNYGPIPVAICRGKGNVNLWVHII